MTAAVIAFLYPIFSILGCTPAHSKPLRLDCVDRNARPENPLANKTLTSNCRYLSADNQDDANFQNRNKNISFLSLFSKCVWP
jgi:uncharacterized lipoprotein NlpE involved in copper resistance